MIADNRRFLVFMEHFLLVSMSFRKDVATFEVISVTSISSALMCLSLQINETSCFIASLYALIVFPERLRMLVR